MQSSDSEAISRVRDETAELKRRMYDLMVHRLGDPIRVELPDDEEWHPHQWVDGAKWRRLCRDIKFAKIASIHAAAGTESKLHFHEHGELIVAQEGNMLLSIQGARYEMGPGDSVVIPPYHLHRILFQTDVVKLVVWFPSPEGTALQILPLE